MKWGLWSKTAGSNSSAPPDGWPEGQLPSTVNDCAREMMASIRTGIEDNQFVDLGVTPTQTGNTTFTLAGNQMQWYSYGNRVKANVGGTLLYGTVTSSTFTTNTGVTLRLDSGILTASLSAVSTGFPSASNNAVPENVYRPTNTIVNGQFDIWQRGNGPFNVSGGAIATYTADRWAIGGSLTSTCALNISRFERSANTAFVPTIAQCGVLLNSSFGISVSAAMTVVNAGTTLGIIQRIEGCDFRQIAQKPFTVSFWINSDQTGTYCLAAANSNLSLACVQTYTINAASTWERKTVTFPKNPSTGVWDYSIGIGMALAWTLVAGSSFQGGAGNWTAAPINATSAQTNFLVSAGNTLMITGIQVDEGTQALPLRPIDFTNDFERCRRRLVALVGTNAIEFAGPAVTNERALIRVPYANQMAQTATTITIPTANNFAGFTAGGIAVSVSSVAVNATTPFGAIMDVHMVGTPLVAGNCAPIAFGAGTVIYFSCDL